jgi:hypothetical protein
MGAGGNIFTFHDAVQLRSHRPVAAVCHLPAPDPQPPTTFQTGWQCSGIGGVREGEIRNSKVEMGMGTVNR